MVPVNFSTDFFTSFTQFLHFKWDELLGHALDTHGVYETNICLLVTLLIICCRIFVKSRGARWLNPSRDVKVTMSNSIHERQERRPIILEGISQDLKQSEIAAQLGVNRWVIINDLRYMRYNGDPELKQAQKTQDQIRAKKQSILTSEKTHAKHNERFLRMTGMTLQEKTFRNMIDFNKHELMKILKSKDQNTAIFRLPKRIRRILMHNGIITKGWHRREITAQARKYLGA